MTEHAVEASGLVKRYGAVTALDGLDLAVPTGTVLGLLGPNGAGKTTAVRVLSTLVPPDAGVATVAGFDVVRQAAEVRTAIGLSGQSAAVDMILTGRENLVMFGQLYHLGAKRAKARADLLLDRFGLTAAADRPARTYSGGMRRRLDLAASLVVSPKVVFLDEPTTGLDPGSRLGLWEMIRELVFEGTTVLLTTQYLEEADALANNILITDNGKVVAQGTADELKARLGGERVELVVGDRGAVTKAAEALNAVTDGELGIHEEDRKVVVPIASGSRGLVDVVRALDAAGVEPHDLVLRRPTLDEVFLALTGRTYESKKAPAFAGGRGGPGRGPRR